MTKEARKAYLLAFRKRYRESNRGAETLILDESCEVCGYARKHAIRVLNRPARGPTRSSKRRVRKPVHCDPWLISVVKTIWFAGDQPCGKRRNAAIPIWLPNSETHFGALASPIWEQLLSLSAATLDRLFKPVRAKHPNGVSATRPGILL